MAGYIGTIVAANWASASWPTVSIGELDVLAGAVCAGLVFSLRDLVHEQFGWRGALTAIAGGIGLSWLLASPAVAMASAAAFATSETADFTAYLALRNRPRIVAMIGSNVAGLLVDSLVFTPLAFGTWDAVGGQIIGKAAATLAAIAAVAVAQVLRRASAR
ncbi:VUT family protein [Amycolatopsis magusensis]|uniref:VUT family protein n=1 Tax=Amycolatopsis magusensis TaxID=882444 RepID=UPI003C2D5993